MLARYSRPVRLLAVGFAAVAGYVDAIGFLITGGFFVSFMSGNTTRLAVGIEAGSPSAAVAAALVALFVLGVMAGALVGRAAGSWRRPAVLMLVTSLLTTAAVVHAFGAGRLVIVPMVFAMGAENTVFAEDGEVRIGLTYMTGTLVKLGKRLVTAMLGGDRFGWLSYLLLWLGLLSGAAVGAVVYRRLGADALWGAAAAMALLTLVTLRLSAAARPPDGRENY